MSLAETEELKQWETLRSDLLPRASTPPRPAGVTIEFQAAVHQLVHIRTLADHTRDAAHTLSRHLLDYTPEQQHQILTYTLGSIRETRRRIEVIRDVALADFPRNRLRHLQRLRDEAVDQMRLLLDTLSVLRVGVEAAEPNDLVLSPEAGERFVERIENPPEPTQDLIDLMAGRLKW